jgi:hypothetical protein
MDLHNFIHYLINEREKIRTTKLVEDLYERVTDLGLVSVTDIVTKIEEVNLWLMNENEDSFEDDEIEFMIDTGNNWLRSKRESTYEMERNQDFLGVQLDTTLLSKSINEKSTRNIWLGDSGASCHMSKSDDGYINHKDISSYIQLGNGEKLKATKIGDKQMTIIQKDGHKCQVILKDCKYVPGMRVNLFSITKALEQGWKLSNNGATTILDHKDQVLQFDHVIPTETGNLVGVVMYPSKDFANMATAKQQEFDINTYHTIMGHTNENTSRSTAKFFNIKLRNNFQTCTACAMAKAKQKAVKKYTDAHSTQPAERLYLDISSIHYESFGGAKYWLHILDDFTDMCWSAFLTSKCEMAQRAL